jgi:hypothetical protein
MPNTTLIREFDVIVNSGAEDDVRRYLEEARKCFIAGANNATVVMAWCGVILYFRRVIEKFGFDFLAYQIWAMEVSQATSPEDAFDNWKRPIVEQGWKEVKDWSLLQACERMGLDAPEKVQVEFRKKRNAFAHPDLKFTTAKKALELVKYAREIYSRRVQDAYLENLATLFSYARQTADGPAVEQIARYLRVSDNNALEYAHKVLDAYVQDEEASSEGLTRLWNVLWNSRDERRRESLWKHIERELQAVLDDDSRALRRPEDLVEFIVWPDPFAEHEARDRIAEKCITWLEDRVSNDEIIDEDWVLVRRLRQHLSGPLRERLLSVLQEM